MNGWNLRPESFSHCVAKVETMNTLTPPTDEEANVDVTLRYDNYQMELGSDKVK